MASPTFLFSIGQTPLLPALKAGASAGFLSEK
jgi:hypothetical protein